MRQSSLLLLVLLFVSLPIVNGLCSSGLDHALVIDSFLIEEASVGGQQRLFLTLINKDEMVDLRKINVNVFSSQGLSKRFERDVLVSGQSVVYETPIVQGNSQGQSYIYLHVSFERRGRKSEFLMPVKLQLIERDKDRGFLRQIFPVLISLVSVGFGAFLTHHFMNLREKEKERANWRKAQFENEVGPYREFLFDWGQGLVHDSMNRHFRKLQQKIIVASEVMDQYEKTFGILEDSQANRSDKVEACRKLAEEIMAYLRKLEPGSR